MKYMTFNSSCSYAGLANLLSFYGIDTEDRKIAVEMGLPYYFDVEDGTFSAGAMLQGEKWFNVYLNPLGFAWKEREMEKAKLCPTLRGMGYAMLGVYTYAGSKHAVIFTGMKNDKFEFLNNKWERADEPDALLLTEKELLRRVEDPAVVGYLVKTGRKPVCKNELLKGSESTLMKLLDEIQTFCADERSVPELRSSMSTIFRPILLDGITMLDLLGQTALGDPLRAVQRQYLGALKENRPLRLAQHLDLDLLREAACGYAALIRGQITEESPVC